MGRDDVQKFMIHGNENKEYKQFRNGIITSYDTDPEKETYSG